MNWMTIKCRKCTDECMQHASNNTFKFNFREHACVQIDLSKIQRCTVKKVDQNKDGSKLIDLSLFGNSNLRASCTVKDSWYLFKI
jgi:hypothetical protein